jgi:hypothetical protein
MSNQPADSATIPSGTPELSVPSFSGSTVGQPNSTEVRDVSELAKRLEETERRLAAAEKRFQSEHDKGVKKVESRMDMLEKAAGYLQEFKDPKKAAREMRLDELASEETSPVEPTSAKISKDEELKSEYKTRIEKHLKKVGIPESEWVAATEAIKGKSYESVDEAVFAAMETAQNYQTNKGKQTAPASVAAASTQTTVTSTHEVSEEEANKELGDLQKGNLRDPKNIARRKELKAILEKANPLDHSVT